MLLVEAFDSDPFTSQSQTRKEMDQSIIATNINKLIYIHCVGLYVLAHYSTLRDRVHQRRKVNPHNMYCVALCCTNFPLSAYYALSGKLVQRNATQSAHSTRREQPYCVRVGGRVSMFFYVCTHKATFVCMCLYLCVCVCVCVLNIYKTIMCCIITMYSLNRCKRVNGSSIVFIEPQVLLPLRKKTILSIN